MVTDIKAFLAISIPSMLLFGMRHALDVDHITAIDNLVRMHNAKKRARWVGTGFSTGHMISVLSEMLLIIYVIGSAASSKVDQLSFYGGVIGAIALATIGAINIYSMKRWGKTGSAILAGKIAGGTHILGPFGSALTIAAMESYSVMTGSDILPPLTGPILAVIIISFAFGYAFATRNRGGRMVIDHHHHTLHPE